MRWLSLSTATCVLVLAGCSNAPAPVPSSPVGPTTSTDIAPQPGPARANWSGDATVISQSGSGGCGWGRAPGETRAGVLWQVTIEGTSVKLDEDMANWPTDDVPFGGTVNGQQFAAAYQQDGSGVCMFRGGTLTGSFSADFSTFDAEETLVWGAGASETRVQRRWHGTKS